MQVVMLVNLMPPSKTQRNRAAVRRWREKNPTHARTYAAERREHFTGEEIARNAELSARWSRLKNYGLSHERYEAMLVAQGNACEICRSPFETSPKVSGGTRKRTGVPHVDHCHRTGAVRGLLCHTCNVRMSVVDNDDALAALISYRDRYRS